MKRNRPLNETKRTAMIVAAIDEFECFGYDAANMDRIAAEAKVAKATIYKHFGSKKELFFVLMQELKTIFDTTHYIQYDPETSLEIQLEKFARQELETVSHMKVMKLSRIAMVALMHKSEVREDLVIMTKNPFFEHLIAWFERAKADEKLVFNDAEFVVHQFIGNIKCFAFYPQLYGAAPLDEGLYDEVIAHAVKVVMTLYGTSSEVPR